MIFEMGNFIQYKYMLEEFFQYKWNKKKEIIQNMKWKKFKPKITIHHSSSSSSSSIYSIPINIKILLTQALID